MGLTEDDSQAVDPLRRLQAGIRDQDKELLEIVGVRVRRRACVPPWMLND